MSLRISFFQDNGRYLRLDYTFLSTMEFFTNDLARPCCSLLANRNGKKLQRRCTPSLAVNRQRNEPRENTNDRGKKTISLLFAFAESLCRSAMFKIDLRIYHYACRNASISNLSTGLTRLVNVAA